MTTLFHELRLLAGLGRIGRWRFLSFQLFYFGVLTEVLLVIARMLNTWLEKQDALALVVFGLLLVGGALKLCLQRFHDLNRSWISLVLMLIPILNTFLAFVLLVFSGDKDANQFGAPPPPNTGWTFVLLFCGALMFFITPPSKFIVERLDTIQLESISSEDSGASRRGARSTSISI